MTPEDEKLQAVARACDGIAHRAAVLMIEQAGASVEMVLDRMMTFCAAQAVTMEGSKCTAEVFRQLADNIERGAFAQIETSLSRERH